MKQSYYTTIKWYKATTFQKTTRSFNLICGQIVLAVITRVAGWGMLNLHKLQFAPLSSKIPEEVGCRISKYSVEWSTVCTSLREYTFLENATKQMNLIFWMYVQCKLYISPRGKMLKLSTPSRVSFSILNFQSQDHGNDCLFVLVSMIIIH